MKYLMIFIALTIANCSDSSDRIIDSLEKLQKETQYNLQSCQNQLEVYQGNIGTNNLQSSEPEKPSESEYSTMDAYHITTKFGDTICYERNNSSYGEELACGMIFSNCKDGYIYRCMIDVKYKIVEERKLVEKEN